VSYPENRRVFIDQSLFEVFVNGETFTGIYNGDTKNTGLYLYSVDGDAKLKRLDFWQIEPVW
jgi:sucrose-6-phosphate hydrolase SacC (GH32 family)